MHGGGGEKMLFCWEISVQETAFLPGEWISEGRWVLCVADGAWTQQEE